MLKLRKAIMSSNLQVTKEDLRGLWVIGDTTTLHLDNSKDKTFLPIVTN